MKNYLLRITNNKYFLLFIGFLIVIYTLYIRIIMKRIPKYFTNDNIYIILSFNMSILFIILLIIRLYIYYRSKHPRQSINHGSLQKIKAYILNIVRIISDIISNSLYILDNVIRDIIPFSANVVEYSGRFLLWIEQCPRKLLLLKILVLHLVPIIFALEIIVFKQLDNYYKILILLLVPLFINYIIYSLRIWYKYQMEGLNSCIKIELTDYIDQIITPGAFAVFYCATTDYPINYNILYLPEYEETRRSNNMPIQEGLLEINDFLSFSCDILGYLLYYDNTMSKYNESIYPIINTALYTIGWIYLFISLYFF